MNEELEKEINGKDEEIMRLKKKLKEAKFKESNDVDKLLEDIEQIKKINREKEDTLAEIVKENQNLKENLSHLEKETEALKEENANNYVEKEYETHLSDELGIVDPRAHNVSPVFEPYNFKSHDVNIGDTLVKKIWKLKQIQLEKSISSQKVKVDL